MTRSVRLRPLAATVPALTVSLLLAGCGSGTPTGGGQGGTAGLTAATPQETASASTLQAATQAVQQAPTLGQLESAVSQLSAALRQAQPIAPSGNAGTQGEWQQALTQLQQAVSSLQKMTAGSSGGSSAPSPLQNPSSSPSTKTSSPGAGNQVGTIIDDLNKGYNLLSQVVKDLAKLGSSTTTSSTSGGAGRSGGSTQGTYTLTIDSGNGGTVYVSNNYGVGQAVNCGSAGGACSSPEPKGQPVEVRIQADSTGDGNWTIKSVSGPQQCELTKPGYADYTCVITRYANTTVSVQFSAPPSSSGS